MFNEFSNEPAWIQYSIYHITPKRTNHFGFQQGKGYLCFFSISEGYEIQNKLIKMFKNFTALDNFATKSMDNELLGKLKIVKTYNHNLPNHIRKIESMCVRDERQAGKTFLLLSSYIVSSQGMLVQW